jgi:hypothetical protein
LISPAAASSPSNAISCWSGEPGPARPVWPSATDRDNDAESIIMIHCRSGAHREVVSAVPERYRSANRMEKERILDALCGTTGWHQRVWQTLRSEAALPMMTMRWSGEKLLSCLGESMPAVCLSDARQTFHSDSDDLARVCRFDLAQGFRDDHHGGSTSACTQMQHRYRSRRPHAHQNSGSQIEDF